MFIVIDVRCFRIQTSGFTSWLHDVLHCLVFKEHPRFPPARCAFRESASIYYLIRFGLSRTFRIYFCKLSRPLGIRLPAAFALVAVCRRLVIYYRNLLLLSTHKNTKLPRMRNYCFAAVIPDSWQSETAIRRYYFCAPNHLAKILSYSPFSLSFLSAALIFSASSLFPLATAMP